MTLGRLRDSECLSLQQPFSLASATSGNFCTIMHAYSLVPRSGLHGRLARRTSGHSCHACSSTCEPILRDACTLSQKGNASIGSRIGEKVALCVVRVLLGHSQRLSRPYLAGNPRGYPHKCAIVGPIGSLSRITYVGEPIGKSRVTIKRPELTV